MRARELGINIGSLPPGPKNAISDVEGVRVGHADVRDPEGAFTGVTVVMPHAAGEVLWRPAFAGASVLSGNGEVTGLEWLRESGMLTTPIALTNTFSVGVVRDAMVTIVRASGSAPPDWVLPVVGETYDGLLNDIDGMHVRAEHVEKAVAAASSGPAVEGCVGAGSGTICHGYKGGIGTSSRMVGDENCVGVLVQANQGRRERLTVAGVPVGARISDRQVPTPAIRQGRGSIIVVIATDAPLISHQCDAIARRASLGIGRAGGVGETDSGDLLIAFATGNRLGLDGGTSGQASATVLPPKQLDQLFDGVIEATEEAIVNALLAATTTTGSSGVTAHALDPRLLLAAMGVNATDNLDRPAEED